MDHVACPSCGVTVERRRLCGECGAPLGQMPVTEEVLPQRRRLVRPIIAVAAAAVGLGVAGAAAVALKGSSTPHHTLTGTILLLGQHRSLVMNDGDPCVGSGGYDDMREGTDVVVKDQSGKIIATSALETGKATNVDSAGYSGSYSSGTASFNCEFNFTVKDLPDEAFYGVEVSHRGMITHSRQDLEKDGWRLPLTLGP
jgi:hypothetical protein